MPPWIKDAVRAFLILVLGVCGLRSEGLLPDELKGVQLALGVPDKLAHVTDAYWPDMGSPPGYILIQDVHRHPQVQKQIAELVLQGYEKWGVRKVFLEGAFTALDLSVFHRVPQKTQWMLLERLVSDGDLSGPELAAVKIMEREWADPPVSPFQLFGMEDPALYRKNLLAYQAVIQRRDRALEDLVSIRRLQSGMHLPESNILLVQLARTEALLRLKLTPSEYEAYLKDRASVPSTPALDPAVRAAEEFYQTAQLRSQVFLTLSAEKVPASRAPRILVMGGFHTAYMAGRLRESGQAFVVISPGVLSGVDQAPYQQHLLQTANDLAQAPRLSPR